MMKRTALALAVLALASGCMGTRVPKLAKCTGPYRYANTNGTVLPSLPIPGQQPASNAGPPPPAVAPAPPEKPAGSDVAPKPDAKPVTTGALPSYYPSC